MEEAEITYQVVTINSTMIYYCTTDIAYVVISSDILWELQQEVSIAEIGKFFA